MSWFDNYKDFKDTIFSLDNGHLYLYSVDNVENKEPFEKLRHWLYCKVNGIDDKKCDFDLSFIPNKKLADKLVDFIQEVPSYKDAYFFVLKERIYKFEDCFGNKPVRKYERFKSDSLFENEKDKIEFITNPVGYLIRLDAKHKAELAKKDEELEAMKAELAKKDEEEDSGWVEGSLDRICSTILKTAISRGKGDFR